MKIIIIDGVIGCDVYAEDIRESLKEAAGEEIRVDLATPGGLISEGLKIYNAFNNYDGIVNTHLAGEVASMGTYIYMVGEKRTAEKNAIFMIHNASMCACGDHFEMFKAGKHLDSLSNMVAKEYSAKSGIELVDIRSLMNREKYYYGDEIKNSGFAHEMVGDKEPQNRDESIAIAKLMFDECLEKTNTPEVVKKEMIELCTMIKLPIKENPGNGPDKNQKQEKSMDLEKLKKDHPDLYKAIVQIGVENGIKDGVLQERKRTVTINSYRSKFPKLSAIFDEAIEKGHDMTELNLNIMSAQGISEELAEATNESENHDTGSGDETETPEMEDGQMNHQDHVDEMSKMISDLPGI